MCLGRPYTQNAQRNINVFFFRTCWYLRKTFLWLSIFGTQCIAHFNRFEQFGPAISLALRGVSNNNYNITTIIHDIILYYDFWNENVNKYRTLCYPAMIPFLIRGHLAANTSTTIYTIILIYNSAIHIKFISIISD